LLCNFHSDVDTVLAVNVFRMVRHHCFTIRLLMSPKVKLFGWEEKMKARIEEKVRWTRLSTSVSDPEQRDGELSWIRKRRIIDMVNGTVRCVGPQLRTSS
jgi:hypothetical protein